MVYVASDHAGVDVTTDNGEAAFKALADLKPNLVKTYTKSSDLINMFTSGEVAAAVVGDFGVPTIVAANPTLVYVTPDGAYANFNTINVTKHSCGTPPAACRRADHCGSFTGKLWTGFHAADLWI